MPRNNKQPEHVLIDEAILVKHRTLKAVLVKQDEREVWIPLSQTHGDPQKGDTKIYVTPWFANQNQLEY